ncbi:hypothetical protein [Chitinophaga nivalis]|uniref:Uncharacterized protein n=1 Tax=Chitinophaga nivalis TaxID=2991709 RepID=A0ABT3IM42_9BACT|nr:hypothetical protein [Chitinophaga nivalis]MCW3465265.1 hypothetical protein [Chitinophaga nivalis]MCW3485043.1 hypothetical protein [Chitinophaga nivalis]
MNGWVYGYYVMMVACFMISLFHLQYKQVKLLTALLAVSILTELIVELMGKRELRFFIVYHFFVVLEYSLITVIIGSGIKSPRWRLLMNISILVFGVVSLLYSFVFGGWNHFPGINITIESFLVICWCLLSFFSITPESEESIFQLPGFWLTLAFFVYFSGSMCVNGFYNLLLASDANSAKHLFTLLNSLSNYLLYIMLIKGIVCFRSNRISM